MPDHFLTMLDFAINFKNSANYIKMCSLDSHKCINTVWLQQENFTVWCSIVNRISCQFYVIVYSRLLNATHSSRCVKSQHKNLIQLYTVFLNKSSRLILLQYKENLNYTQNSVFKPFLNRHNNYIIHIHIINSVHKYNQKI